MFYRNSDPTLKISVHVDVMSVVIRDVDDDNFRRLVRMFLGILSVSTLAQCPQTVEQPCCASLRVVNTDGIPDRSQ